MNYPRIVLENMTAGCFHVTQGHNTDFSLKNVYKQLNRATPDALSGRNIFQSFPGFEIEHLPFNIGQPCSWLKRKEHHLGLSRTPDTVRV